MATAEQGVQATRARVVHTMPGRIRLRFDRGADIEPAAQRLQDALTNVAGVVEIEPRPGSRSVLVYYNPDEVESQEMLLGAVGGAGIDLSDSKPSSNDRSSQDTRVGSTIARAVGRANTGLGSVSRMTLDLRDVFPMTLLAFGLRRVAQGQLQPVPWYNLLYYGYSTFASLHGKRSAGSGPDAREILRRRYAQGELSKNKFQTMMRDLG